MYANFYYQRSTKKYGRGPWIKKAGMLDGSTCPFRGQTDFLYIGEVYDRELFANAELTP